MFAELYAGMGPVQIAVLIASAILIGINKTAIPGIGVLPVIMLTMAVVAVYAFIWVLSILGVWSRESEDK